MEFKIQWFPGHMTKAKRMMEKQIKLVDIVIEMLDARIPYSSSNPILMDIIGNKPKIIVFNKVDLADIGRLDAYAQKLKNKGIPLVYLNSVIGGDYKKLLTTIRTVAQPMLEKWQKKGVKNKAVRVMIVGIPNVGKSSLINRLLGKSKVKTGDKPGVTRGEQWINIGNNIELLDTPGILWPKFEEPEIGFSLAVTGAIKDEVFDNQQAVEILLSRLLENYPEALKECYDIEIDSELSIAEILLVIAQKRGCLRSGGVPDISKVINIVLREYRDGKIGRFVIDNV